MIELVESKFTHFDVGDVDNRFLTRFLLVQVYNTSLHNSGIKIKPTIS